MPNKTTNQFRMSRRSSYQLLDDSHNVTKENLNRLCEKYNAKWTQVCAKKESVNIKMKITKRQYFYALSPTFPEALKKLEDFIERGFTKIKMKEC